VRTLTKTNPATGEIRVTGRFQLGNDTTAYLSSKQIEAATGFAKNFDVLVGSKLSVQYYKVGEELINDAVCTKENTIVSEFEFELTSKLTSMKTASALGMSLFNM